jgi:hypothetical protein
VKVLFCSDDWKDILKITRAFLTDFEMRRVYGAHKVLSGRQSAGDHSKVWGKSLEWQDGAAIHTTYGKYGMREIVMKIWRSEGTDFVQFETPDDAQVLLFCLVDARRMLGRSTPVRADGRIVSLSALIAIAALAAARGSWGQEARILWDMAEDREI